MRDWVRALFAVLRGDPREARRDQVLWATRVVIAAGAAAANLIGVLIVVILLVAVLPVPAEVDGDSALISRNLVVAAAYTLVAIAYGVMRGVQLSRRLDRWLVEDREPTERERELSLQLPQHVLVIQSQLWIVAAVLFAALNLPDSQTLALEIGATITLGGIATAAISYLIQTRQQRAVVALALADVPPRDYAVPGVAARAALSWTLATGVPVTGAILISAATFFEPVSAEALARAAIALCAIGLAVGLLATWLFARSIAGPLEQLRRGLQRVERGELNVSVPIADATELGFVQSGFNRMVHGLEERERLRDLFGRHVGEDVARQAMEQGVSLGGEEREAAALFVDVIGSTRFASERPPGEVVAALNSFFAIVVEVARAHGGFVNKFEGDAALCIFGAPLPLGDACGAALAAARELAERLAAEVDELEAGIGVSAGTVVAGNVGAEDRFEYTVIGDPVNEAARLTELAKDLPGRTAVSEAVLAGAGEDERALWKVEEEVKLRGRSEPTCVAVPR